jgi:hypothetical protein
MCEPSLTVKVDEYRNIRHEASSNPLRLSDDPSLGNQAYVTGRGVGGDSGLSQFRLMRESDPD